MVIRLKLRRNRIELTITRSTFVAGTFERDCNFIYKRNEIRTRLFRIVCKIPRCVTLLHVRYSPTPIRECPVNWKKKESGRRTANRKIARTKAVWNLRVASSDADSPKPINCFAAASDVQFASRATYSWKFKRGANFTPLDVGDALKNHGDFSSTERNYFENVFSELSRFFFSRFRGQIIKFDHRKRVSPNAIYTNLPNRSSSG